MHSVRYETVGRDAHRHGRVSCLLDVDIRQKKLFVRCVSHNSLYSLFTTVQPVVRMNRDFILHVLDDS